MKRVARGVTQNWAAPIEHAHTKADVTGLQAELDAKASVAHEHADLQAAIDAKAPSDHDHGAAYEAAGAVAAHAAANDPHPGYQRESEKGQANGYASLGADGKVPTAQLPAGQAGAAWGGITGTLSDQTDLNTALSGKASTTHNHDAAYAAIGHNHDVAYEAKNVNIQAHIASTANPHSVTKSQVGLANVDNTSDAAKPISTAMQAALDGKAAASHTHALTSSSAFATAETTISAATYADIAGCSLSLAAGTWLIMGQVNIRAANAIVQAFVAITDGANAVISEVSASRPASGTASLNSPFSCNPIALVSPGGTTTYKLRGARGVTTHTGSWMAMDGNGVNTANHATNNTDKGTAIFAVKIA